MHVLIVASRDSTMASTRAPDGAQRANRRKVLGRPKLKRCCLLSAMPVVERTLHEVDPLGASIMHQRVDEGRNPEGRVGYRRAPREGCKLALLAVRWILDERAATATMYQTQQSDRPLGERVADPDGLKLLRPEPWQRSTTARSIP